MLAGHQQAAALLPRHPPPPLLPQPLMQPAMGDNRSASQNSASDFGDQSPDLSANVWQRQHSNDDLNASDMESDGGCSEPDIRDIDTAKLDASHREILEKLKRQEEEERAEIELELRQKVGGSLKDERRRQNDDDQDDEEETGEGESDGGEDSLPKQTEIKTQRPPGLLAQHGLTTKTHSSSSLMDRKNHNDKDVLSGKGDLTKAPINTEHSIHATSPMDFPHPAFLDRRAFIPSPPSVPHTPPGHPGSSRDSNAGSPLGSSTPGHHWTFEEQFKQLYELSDDPKRREFLDDLFAFMQKRGTPVNRIPIMAKQTLDLYELFRLVVSKGGLVEVINKKLWREITKGLNLPSSITSAAFTLRTQYMKYLYPYECEKLKLSNPSELQSAIDGNRREGRRPSYGYDFSPIPTMLPTPPPPPPHLNGLHALNGSRGPPHTDGGLSSLWGAPRGPLKDSPWNVLPPSLHLPPTVHDDDMDQPKNLKKEKEDNGTPLTSSSSHLRSLAERDARAMEAAARAMEAATKRIEDATAGRTKESRDPTPTSAPLLPTSSSSLSTPLLPSSIRKLGLPNSRDEPPNKRPFLDEDRFINQMGMRSAHMKLTSRGDGRSELDNSMVVSMEINGTMYQGVLFAQPPPRGPSRM